MGVSTKRVKRLMRDHTTSWESHGRYRMASSERDPAIVVVYDPLPWGDLVITVLPRTYDRYDSRLDTVARRMV
jgi:hypothetical protein